MISFKFQSSLTPQKEYPALILVGLSVSAAIVVSVMANPAYAYWKYYFAYSWT
jgi:hypothetical protein